MVRTPSPSPWFNCRGRCFSDMKTNTIKTANFRRCAGVLFMVSAAAIGCGKKMEYQPLNRPDSSVSSRSIADLSHKRVKELFVVLFEKNFEPQEWKVIFDQTGILSANKKKIRQMEGQIDDASIEVRTQLITENGELLDSLSQKSLFMMNWSAQDENCKLALKEFWQLVCKPRNQNNPLNGGLPHGVGAVEWVNPDPVVSMTKIPYLRIRLKKEHDETGASALKYALELRLKEERVSETESWFKGEAFPSKGSTFIRADGTTTQQVFPYGYAELTLGK